MANIALRIIAGVCLAGAALAGLCWWDTDRTITPISKTVTLPIDKIKTLSFMPTQDISNRNYVLKLNFKTQSTFSLNCNNIASLSIRWSISNNANVESWSEVVGSSKSPKYSCYASNNRLVAEFAIAQLKPFKKYYLHLANNSQIKKLRNIEINVAIQHESSMELHYLFADLAVAETFLIVLSGITILCIMIDCFLVTRKKY